MTVSQKRLFEKSWIKKLRLLGVVRPQAIHEVWGVRNDWAFFRLRSLGAL